ncbi:hypothetical protein [Kitasatospora sp. NPDC094011]|uniref:hypothetical protein n=1 Tax=Kitasatospora sp. NPDC094011 TaxID=3364090 RepID=UPI003812B6D9
MRIKGISYDTGFVRSGACSRKRFEPELVREELRIIRDDLHCNAVRIMGGDPDRIELAAGFAAELGLEIWYSPYPLELAQEELLELLADCARRAERLRRTGAEVVFLTGAELSLMNRGFLPGDSTDERIALLARPEAVREHLGAVSGRVNAFLRTAVATVRTHFGGPVSYAAVPLERVDWEPFDLVSLDLYRDATTADRFAGGVRELTAQSKAAHGKPVAVTEFGSATYRGAGDRGAMGLEIVEYDADGPVRLTGVHERDEAGQAAYVRELLAAFDAGGIDAAFVFTFALYDFVHRPDGDPREDLDLASYGLVKVGEDRHGDRPGLLPWEPKLSFAAVGEYYRTH